MFEQAGEAGGRFANAFTDQAGTFNQIVSNMKDSFAIFSVEIMTKSGIFDGVKRGLTNFMQYINDHKQDIINFVTNTITKIQEWGAMVATFLAPIIQWFKDFFAVPENRKAALYGFFIAIGVLLAAFIIAFIAAHITIIAIFAAITLVVGFFYRMWTENWGGIRDTMTAVWEAIKVVMQAFKEGWDAWGVHIWNSIKGVFSMIWQYIKFVFNVITDVLAMFYLLFTGKWGALWELIKSATSARMNDIKNIFSTGFDAVKEYITGLYNFFVGRFTEMWNKAKEIADKIRHAISDAFDKDERNSPSIADRLKEVVQYSSDTLKKIAIPDFSHDIATNIAGITDGMNVNFDMQPTQAKTIIQNITNNIADTMDIDTLNDRLAFKYRNA